MVPNLDLDLDLDLDLIIHSVVVTNLDHDGNVTPWTLMAAEKGITVRRCLIFILSQEDVPYI